MSGDGGWLQQSVSSSILTEMRKRWAVRNKDFVFFIVMLYCLTEYYHSLAESRAILIFSSLYHKISHFHIENANNPFVLKIFQIFLLDDPTTRRVIMWVHINFLLTYSALVPTPSMIKFSIWLSSYLFSVSWDNSVTGRFFLRTVHVILFAFTFYTKFTK